jgi:hypothetical protein
LDLRNAPGPASAASRRSRRRESVTEAGELHHPAVLHGRLERLDPHEIAFGEAGVRLVLREIEILHFVREPGYLAVDGHRSGHHVRNALRLQSLGHDPENLELFAHVLVGASRHARMNL